MVGGSSWFRTGTGWVGVGVDVGGGPGVHVDSDRFSGDFREWAVSPSFRWWLPLGRAVAFEWFAGLTAQATSLEGVTLPDARSAEVRRINGAIDSGIALRVRVAPTVDVGAAAGMSYFVRYQRYLVNGETVFAPRQLTQAYEAQVAMDIF
jgi:hypothetical protein